jgi:hypothetical protein
MSDRRKPVTVSLAEDEVAVVANATPDFTKTGELESVQSKMNFYRPAKSYKLIGLLAISFISLFTLWLGYDLWLFAKEISSIHPILGYVTLGLSVTLNRTGFPGG